MAEEGAYWVPEHVRAYLRALGLSAAAGGHGGAHRRVRPLDAHRRRVL